MTWDPQQYLKFAQPRLRPALDLLARVGLESPARVCDLGCGAGNVTRVLAARWPQAAIVGVDDSAEMLAQAKATAPATTALTFIQADLATFAPDRPFDLIYSNAALHWSPDHRALFPKLIRDLERGGVLAVQMPRNFGAPSHVLVADTIRSARWRARLEPLLGPVPVMEASRYYDLLAPFASELDIWETEYLHVLEGQDPVKEWLKGSYLTQFLAHLTEPERAEFESDYASRVATAYPARDDGKTLFPFRRLFIVLRKSW